MSKINFKKVTMKNFLSIGNSGQEFIYNKGIHAVTGHVEPSLKRNGVGKCLRGDTEIEISFEDEETYNEFIKFIENYL
jgi:hypothetical protein